MMAPPAPSTRAATSVNATSSGYGPATVARVRSSGCRCSPRSRTVAPMMCAWWSGDGLKGLPKAINTVWVVRSSSRRQAPTLDIFDGGGRQRHLRGRRWPRSRRRQRRQRYAPDIGMKHRRPWPSTTQPCWRTPRARASAEGPMISSLLPPAAPLVAPSSPPTCRRASASCPTSTAALSPEMPRAAQRRTDRRLCPWRGLRIRRAARRTHQLAFKHKHPTCPSPYVRI